MHARVEAMSAGGILASMNFPSFPGLATGLGATDDPDLPRALVRAYNDWQIDEWCGAYPGRFVPLALPMIWDAELCADEVRRVAAKRCHSLTFTEYPAALGYPSFHDSYWDPLWRALCDTSTVLSMPLGSAGWSTMPTEDSPPQVLETVAPMNIAAAAADLLWSAVFEKFPDLRIALPEGGIGWVPYFLERADRIAERLASRTRRDFGAVLPSEVFRKHFLTCFISDPVGINLRRRIGIDNICWAAGYPHSDSAWPTAPEDLYEVMDEDAVWDSDINKMTHENAMRWYSFDPFLHIPKERATVGVLRESVADREFCGRTRAQAPSPSRDIPGSGPIR